MRRKRKEEIKRKKIKKNWEREIQKRKETQKELECQSFIRRKAVKILNKSA